MSGTSAGVTIQPWHAVSAQDQLDFYVRNREAFGPWEPVRGDEFFTVEYHMSANQHAGSEWAAGRNHSFAVLSNGVLAGRVSLSNVVRGAAQCAHIGYTVDAAMWGRGIATTAVRLSLHEAFTTFRLHRVEAAVMPRNTRSVRVIEKCRFARVGLSPRHLLIAGRWEDHLLFELTVEDWSAQQPS